MWRISSVSKDTKEKNSTSGKGSVWNTFGECLLPLVV